MAPWPWPQPGRGLTIRPTPGDAPASPAPGGGRRSGRPRLGRGLIVLVGCLCLAGAAAPAPPAPVTPIPPGSQAQMDEIRFTEIQEGEKKWELVAQRADYLKDQEIIRLTRVQVDILARDGQNIKLQGDQADIHIKSRQLTVTGNVRAQVDDYVAVTSQVIYHPKERQLVAPEDVTLEGPRLAITGRHLTVDLLNKKMLLQKHTQTRWQLAGKPWKP